MGTQSTVFTPTPVRKVRNCTPDSEKELIARVVHSEPAAARQFVFQYRRYIFRILSYMGIGSEDQGDIFQQVFLHLWEDDCRRLRQWHGGASGKFTAYLRVIVTRLARNYLNCRHTMPLASCSDPIQTLLEQNSAYARTAAAQDPVQEIVRQESAEAIIDVVRRLVPRDAQLLIRRHWQQQSYNEIATALGITVNHVGVALGRAETRLKKVLCTRYPHLFQGDT